MGLNRIRIRKSIREHPLVITAVPSDFDRSGVERRFTRVSPRFRASSIARLFPSRAANAANAARSIGKANLWLLPLPSINSFQTTKDYLLPFQTEANAYRRRQSGDNLWPRNRESVFAPSRFFPSLPCLPAFNRRLTISRCARPLFILKKERIEGKGWPLNFYGTIDSGYR